MSDTTQAPFTFAAAKPKTEQQEMADKQPGEPAKNGRRKNTSAPAATKTETKKRKTRQRKPDPLPAMIRAMNELSTKHQTRVLTALQEIFG